MLVFIIYNFDQQLKKYKYCSLDYQNKESKVSTLAEYIASTSLHVLNIKCSCSHIS